MAKRLDSALEHRCAHPRTYPDGEWDYGDSSSGRKGGPKEFTFLWEGKDKDGKIVRGEMRAAGEAVVNATLRRQGILVTKVKKQRLRRRRQRHARRTSRCSRASWRP